MPPVEVRRGVTRTVYLWGRWAFKVPGGYGNHGLRGWLANRSEWRRRKGRRKCRPVATLLHFVLVMPRAERVAEFGEPGPWDGKHCGDARKASSWGRFGGEWLQLDYDLSWCQRDRGLVGALYYGMQERRARRLMGEPPC